MVIRRLHNLQSDLPGKSSARPQAVVFSVSRLSIVCPIIVSDVMF